MDESFKPYQIVLSETARADLHEATDFFDSQKVGLGGDFYEEFLHVSKLISQNPEMYQEHLLFIRRGLMKRFRFHIFYGVDSVNKLIDVIAILHQKQDPNILPGRLNIEL